MAAVPWYRPVMYRLAEFTIDPHRFELLKDGERLKRTYLENFPGRTAEEYIASMPVLAPSLVEHVHAAYAKLGLA